MDSVRNAQKMQAHSDVMLDLSRRARQHYIDGMREGVGDDELRHRHYDAMEAHSKAAKAFNATLGERKVVYHS